MKAHPVVERKIESVKGGRVEGAKPGQNALTVARLWGAHPPAWVLELAEACDRTSQGAVARRLGISTTVVNQALSNSYAGRLDRMEQRVRGELMRETVQCPVLGEINTRACLDHQSRGYQGTNSTRVRLFTACRRCQHRRES